MDDDLSSLTINRFCQRNAVSRTKFYDLARKGKGPRLMDVGGMHRISKEAEAAWRRQCEKIASEKEGAS